MMQRILERMRDNRSVGEAGGILILLLAVAVVLSLLTYDARDSSAFTHPGNGDSHNFFGWGGSTVAESLLQLFGTAAFVLPFLLARFGWNRIRGREIEGAAARTVGVLLLVAFLAAVLDLLYGSIRFGGELFGAGGYVGAKNAAWMRALFSRPGAIAVSGTLLIAVTVLTTGHSFVRTVEVASRWAAVAWAAIRRSVEASLDRSRTAWAEMLERRRQAADDRAAAEKARPEPPPTPRVEQPVERKSIRLKEEPAPEPAKLIEKPEPPPAPRPVKRPTPRQVELPMEPPKQPTESEQELLDRARHITEKFREFSVNGNVVAIHPGPVVTTFEFKPEAGIKYSKITGMTDDLSLALKAESVRIDRMPGKATVGIEVPNRRQETIYPRELFDSSAFRDSPSKLTLALGKDIGGHVAVAELDRMPHLLIAGATGAGKSVGLNCMIASVLFKATPDEARFIMIDTKMIELGVYSDIPHLLIPVVTDAKHASTALKWAVREMEQRYRKLAAVGVRNLAQFNDLMEKEPDREMEDPKTGEPVPLSRMPMIVIVIDELADLMMVASSDVEESIMRLAQMARAVGIHLIIATQRPSVDVITGTIKANFPSRIAFRVSQRVDSRTIIDQQGAEHLLGRGDMLYLSSGSSRLRRLHGGFLTETELNRITTYIKKMAEPVYDETILKDPAEEAGGSIDGAERDEMYARAVRTILDEGKCSITLIQRRLQLGYARAARIVDMMEREGVVSLGEGSKPREILVGPEFLDQL
jgi:S-DNA-T family DNA segregation ATPase FtsK/SpoIIIE